MVIWSRPAREDLKQIHEFISRDSKQYARKVTDDIVSLSESIEQLPLRGRIVPEIDNPAIRELFAYSYRLIYEVIGERIHILAVIHFRRDLSRMDLNV